MRSAARPPSTMCFFLAQYTNMIVTVQKLHLKAHARTTLPMPNPCKDNPHQDQDLHPAILVSPPPPSSLPDTCPFIMGYYILTHVVMHEGRNSVCTSKTVISTQVHARTHSFCTHARRHARTVCAQQFFSRTYARTYSDPDLI